MPLRLKTAGHGEDYKNFDGRGSCETVERLFFSFWNQETGKRERVVSYVPIIEPSEPAALIGLWERLEWHRQTLLKARESKTCRAEWKCVWEAKYAQTNLLARKVIKRMESIVEETKRKNGAFAVYSEEDMEWTDMEDICSAYGLVEPQDFILYRFANGQFPCDMHRSDILAVRCAVEHEVNVLMDEPHTERTRGFWLSRYQRRKKMLAELKEMADWRGFDDGLPTLLDEEEDDGDPDDEALL